MRVAITGGTGFVGRHLANLLLSLGQEVVIISRGLHSSEFQVKANDKLVKVVMGLTSAVELAEAFQGCEAVCHCAGIARELGDQSFETVHVEGTRHVLAACRQAKVRKVVLTSFLRARPHPESPYHSSKWKAEELVRGSGLDYTILKAGVLYGEGDQFTTNLRNTLKRIPLFGYVGFQRRTARPVSIADLCQLIVASLDDSRLSRKTVPVLGPEEIDIQEVVRRIAHQVGKTPVVLPLPVIVHKAMAWVMEQTMAKPLVTSAQITMLSEGLSEASQPYDALPEDLKPQTAFLR